MVDIYGRAEDKDHLTTKDAWDGQALTEPARWGQETSFVR